MKKIISKINRKIKEIRRSNQKTRRNWLILFTTITMILVISAWVWYISFTVYSVPKPDTEISGSNDVPISGSDDISEDKVSAISVFVRGYKVIKNSLIKNFNEISRQIKPSILKIKEKFKNVKEYIPEDSNSLPLETQN